MEKDKKIIQFLESINKLKPEKIIGLAKVVGVKVLTEQVDPTTKKAIARNGEDILIDILAAFYDLDRNSRRWLLKFVNKEL